ncbi:hypothetical protein NX794_32970 [Streptomyces sp. LP11]|uniref:Integral membrane protein n=1 Tax=Streptomyces pyxinicus TaxID=2970331 RepID=A0ABT2BBU4_9ACTN|nr:hypothetical protein [Streptomyces sp. LP11]MCS0605984.1 hypothetical protein [Streptomyces sp. LP11]
MLARVHARARAKAGRVATAAGAAVLTGGLFTDFLTGPGIAAAVTTAGLGLATNIKILKAPSSAKATAIGVYASPHMGTALLLVGERLAPDNGVSLLVQASVVAVWTGATWFIRPGRLARELVDEAVLQEIAAATKDAEEKAAAEVAVLQVDPDESDAARWWRQEFTGEGGIAPGTVLLEHQRVSEECVALVVGSAQRGTPVPDISKPRLSAHLDVPEELIELGPVPGRGAGVRLLTIGPRPQPPEEAKTAGSDEEVWKEIAATAMPGVELIEANTYEIRKELT